MWTAFTLAKSKQHVKGDVRAHPGGGGMSEDQPPAFTVEAVMTAFDEDAARAWLEAWSAAPRQLRTLMESDVAAAAADRARREPGRAREQRRFREIVAGCEG
jgi:hypothetical protein